VPPQAVVRTWVALAAPLAIACSDGPTAQGDARGTFRATLSKTIAETVSGKATYFVFREGSSSIYRVELVANGAASGFSLTILGDGARLPVGTYAIMPGPGMSPQPPTVIATACVNTSQPCFTDWRVESFSNGGAGRLEISRSSAGVLDGSLEVDLLGEGGFSGTVLHVSAKFNAACEPPQPC
jgi:hypothetical protein